MDGIDVGGRINLRLFFKKGYERHCEHGDELSSPMKALDSTHRRPGLSFDRFR
jgi:hypothetical protein